MKDKGQETGEYKFQKPPDGYHLIQFGEGIDFLKNAEGELVKSKKKGETSLKFPATIVDDDDPANGMDASRIAPVSDFGEGIVYDILKATKLYKKFAEKFPGEEVNVFASPVLDAIKTKIPGLFMRVKLETNKDDYQNVVWYGAADTPLPKDDDKPAAKGKGKGKDTAKAPAATGDGW